TSFWSLGNHPDGAVGLLQRPGNRVADVLDSSSGVRGPRAARGPHRRRGDTAGRAETAGAACSVAPERERGRLPGPPRRRSLGRARAGECAALARQLRLASACTAWLRSDRAPSTWLSAPGGAG